MRRIFCRTPSFSLPCIRACVLVSLIVTAQILLNRDRDLYRDRDRDRTRNGQKENVSKTAFSIVINEMSSKEEFHEMDLSKLLSKGNLSFQFRFGECPKTSFPRTSLFV